MKRNLSKPLILAVILSLYSSVGHGQEAAKTEEEIEEIVVYGEKSLLLLKKEVVRASEVVFESFNALNDDDDFDIHCSDRVPTGSRIAKGSCKPEFENRIYHEATQRRLDMMDGNVLGPGFLVNNAEVEGKMKKKKKQMDAKMETLARENPEFAKAIIDLYKAEVIFAAEKERRCEGRIICSKNAPDLNPSLDSGQ